MRIKGPSPALREKKRYVAFAVECDDALKRDDVAKLIWREAAGFFGEKAMAAMNLRVLDFDEDAQLGFLVCHHKAVGDIMASLALVNSTDGRRVHIAPLGVSGTISALKRKFLGKRLVLFENIDSSVDLFGGLRLARRKGQCLDALPTSEELQARAKNLNVRFVGLMENEVYLSQRK